MENEDFVVEDKSLAGVPLIASVAQKIALELFKTKPQWNRNELCAEVEKLHYARGGVNGKSKIAKVMDQVIDKLSGSRAISNACMGVWRINGFDVASSNPDSTNNSRSVEDGQDECEEMSEIKIEKIIGDGYESVYVYYDPVHRELAGLKGRNFWACKIGKTEKSVTGRIFDQGIKTAFSYYPVVGLVIKTDDSSMLERIIHIALRSSEIEPMECPGTEWFLTSPEMIEKWYDLYMKSLEILKVAGE